jgi:hypothetical protein
LADPLLAFLGEEILLGSFSLSRIIETVELAGFIFLSALLLYLCLRPWVLGLKLPQRLSIFVHYT